MKDFKTLVGYISDTHHQLQQHASNAVNQSLTIRNWLIGYYIVEYEQNGEDRAKYGEKLIISLANELSEIKGLDKRSLHRFRQFYFFYPQIAEVFQPNAKVGSMTPLLENFTKVGSLTPLLKLQSIYLTLMENDTQRLRLNGKTVLAKLSYTQIEQFLKIDDPLKRTFYELECIIPITI